MKQSEDCLLKEIPLREVGNSEEANLSERVRRSIRDKFAALQSMRSNEMQEALARERQLSYIIDELKKRSAESEMSQEAEREINQRKSFYLIKEGECMRHQVQLLDQKVLELQQKYDKDISRLQESLRVTQERLVEEKLSAKEQESKQEKAIQNLVTSLYVAQKEAHRHEKECSRLVTLESVLNESRKECRLAQAECRLWKYLLHYRDELVLHEREEFLNIVQKHMAERERVMQHSEKSRTQEVGCCIEAAISKDEYMCDVYHELKELALQLSSSHLELRSLRARRLLEAQELKILSEKREDLVAMFDYYKIKADRTQRENTENLAMLKSVNDAKLAFMLRQRDEEVMDELFMWKGAFLEGVKLMEALLKRYQPFQRGDEMFVSRVIEYVNGAAKMRESASVSLD